MRVRLQTKLYVLIVTVFVALALLLAWRQADWAERFVIDRVEKQLEHDARGAWRAVDSRRAQIETIADLLAGDPPHEGGGASWAADSAHREALRTQWGLDVLGVETDGVEAGGAVMADLLARFGRDATSGASGYAVVPAGVARTHPGLADRLRHDGTELPALFVFALAPRRPAGRPSSGGRVVVAALLNEARPLIDGIQTDLFAEEVYRGRKLGTATLFAGPVRVATTVLLPDGRPALGTRVSAEVEARVLGEGRPWTGRADVAGTPYIARYEPIRDPLGTVVGMLYVGELEQFYLDLKRRTLTGNLAAVLLLMFAALGLSVGIVNRILRQVRSLDEATKAFAAGNFAARARATSRDEIGQLARSFNEMAELIEADRARILRQQEEIRETNRNYIDLLSFVTHELRSSLSAAMLNISLLRRGSYGELGADQQDGVRAVDATLQRLNDLTLNYLQLSRIEEGHRMIHRQPLDLRRDVIDPVLEGLATQLDEAGMTVDNRVPPGLEVAADRALIRIVYQNLLTNAVKFGRRGGRIELDAGAQPGRAVLTVRNDGAGISPERIPEMFRKFRHFDVDSEHGKQGTGVGLFIVKQIIEQHGGEIAAESEPGRSATFRFTLLR